MSNQSTQAELLPERCRTCGSIMQVVSVEEAGNFAILIGKSIEGGFQSKELAEAEIRRRASPPAQAEWRDIENAPKESRQILVARIIEGEVYWACTARWSEQYQCWFDGIEPGGLAGPTHWTLVPPPNG